MAKKPKKEKKYKPADGTRTIQLDKPLTFKLTTDDKARMFDERADLEQQIGSLELELNKAKEEINGKIKPLGVKLEKLSAIAAAGEEVRTVKCIQEMDFVKGEVSYVFEGVVMETRSMTQDEHQMDLAIVPGEKKMTKRKKFPGNGNDAADFKKAAAGDDDRDDDDNVRAIIGEQTNRRTARSSVDGPTGTDAA